MNTVTIKAISLWQPWATLIALGEKQFETRSWSPRYIGPLAIHAAKKQEWANLSVMGQEPFRSILARHGYTRPEHLPYGAIVAMARLSRIDPAEGIRNALTDQERAFGDFSDGRFGWFLRPVKPFKEPIECVGHQSLWDWDCPARTLHLFNRIVEESGVLNDPSCKRSKPYRPVADCRDD